MKPLQRSNTRKNEHTFCCEEMNLRGRIIAYAGLAGAALVTPSIPNLKADIFFSGPLVSLVKANSGTALP
jgi:hypothetical protein